MNQCRLLDIWSIWHESRLKTCQALRAVCVCVCAVRSLCAIELGAFKWFELWRQIDWATHHGSWSKRSNYDGRWITDETWSVIGNYVLSKFFDFRVCESTVVVLPLSRAGFRHWDHRQPLCTRCWQLAVCLNTLHHDVQQLMNCKHVLCRCSLTILVYRCFTIGFTLRICTWDKIQYSETSIEFSAEFRIWEFGTLSSPLYYAFNRCRAKVDWS